MTKSLVDTGVNPLRMSAMSYGEYRPTLPNINENNKRKNRRVDIVIISKQYNQLEPKVEK